ncbi:unnamed protein product [Phaedon cochleariae]|uniref:DDB1- and CUL4-associated factor 5 n=1 Tax=Phaedon cochleariae TaxID=80249 RepID=A0A9P0DGI1_PHACE|nr:unnamed protein product [Phaedon cochleariae]
MAIPSCINPVRYLTERQYSDNIFIKNNLFSARFANARNLFRKDLVSHYGCVNAVEFSVDGEFIVSGGDDKRVLMWTVPLAIYDQGAPVVMRTTHRSNIFCLTFDSNNEKIFSGGNDDQVLIHEVHTITSIGSIPHEKPVYGISIHPQNNNIIATAGEDGRILLFDVRDTSQDAQVVAEHNSGFHSVKFNPLKPRYLVTANSEEGIQLWDCRKPKSQLLHYDSQSGKTNGISACFDCTGKKVLALRRRLPPVLYNAESESSVCQFYHPQYYNSCTMKTCCFAGENDEYILSGSDDFNLYMWKVPTDDSEWGASHMVLRGHRSIVNQVRYNNHNKLIASSGVEKMVKLWSTLPISNWKGSILKEHTEPVRAIYTHEDYMSIVVSTDRINHDYSDQSINEDTKMMAFFDSLIQREIEGWDSKTDATFSTDTDSDEEDSTKVIAKIFKNGGSTYTELKKYRSNRIMQLISKKKNTLARLARSKSTSYVHRYNQHKAHKRKSTKSKARKHNGTHKKSKKSSAERDTAKRQKKEPRTSKYLTRQSARNMAESAEATSNGRSLDAIPNGHSLDTPSTSTGITSSEVSVFRLVEDDSDDEVRPANGGGEVEDSVVEGNFVNILPTPLNGTRDVLINVLEVVDEDTRNSRNQTIEEEIIQDTAAVNSLSNTNSIDDAYNTESSDSDFEYLHTPKRRCISVSADSGCGTGPSSSSSSCSTKDLRSHHQVSGSRTADDSDKKNRGRWSTKTRKSVRRKIGADSDEN